jgi:hypothetical protein
MINPLENILQTINDLKSQKPEIDRDTCVWKFNARRTLRPTQEQTYCRNCPTQNYETCERYKALGRCEIRYSHLR